MQSLSVLVTEWWMDELDVVSLWLVYSLHSHKYCACSIIGTCLIETIQASGFFPIRADQSE